MSNLIHLNTPPQAMLRVFIIDTVEMAGMLCLIGQAQTEPPTRISCQE